MTMKYIVALSLPLIAPLPSIANAGEIAAIVENVSNADAGVKFLESLEPGHKIDLLNGGSITIGYLRSCIREVITGGHITIGKNQSSIEGGSVKRLLVECDIRRLILTANQSKQSAVAVFRQKLPSPKASSKLQNPNLKIYGTSPLVSLKKPGQTILFKRLDKADKPISVNAQGNYVDFANINISLKFGATYRVTAGGKVLIIKIDPLARNGKIPIISRLIRF